MKKCVHKIENMPLQPYSFFFPSLTGEQICLFSSKSFCVVTVKFPEISPWTYIFQRPFLRGFFLEGPIFGGAYVRREICVSKSIGLACSGTSSETQGQIVGARESLNGKIWQEK